MSINLMQAIQIKDANGWQSGQDMEASGEEGGYC